MQRQKQFDKSCHLLKKELRNLGGLLSRFPDNKFLRHKFFSTKKEYKRLTKRLKRNFKHEMLNKIQFTEEHNPKEFWKLVKSIKSNDPTNIQNEISPLIWHDYFKNLNEKKVIFENSSETQFVGDYRFWAVKFNHILDPSISEHEVRASAKKLDNKKSSAEDVMSNEIIKIAVEVLAPYFVKLFNHVLFHGTFPHSWSEGYIIPLYKSGCRSDPENYREICISSCLGNFFTSILNSRFNTFLEEHEILNKCMSSWF